MAGDLNVTGLFALKYVVFLKVKYLGFFLNENSALFDV
mgnify:CR=1 FL=1